MSDEETDPGISQTYSENEPDPDLVENMAMAHEASGSWRERVVAFQQEHPYAATVLETTAVWAGRQALRYSVSKCTDKRVGHGWHNSRFGKKFGTPAVAFMAGVVAAPLGEELIARKAPSDALYKRGITGPQKAFGTAAALVFAAGHAGKDAVPVTQFAGGLNYWRLQRGRSYKHAVVAHATHNSLSLLTGALNKRKHQSHR